MVKQTANSRRKGANGVPTPRAYRKNRALTAKIRPKKRFVSEHVKSKTPEYVAKFRESQTPKDKLLDTAVREALWRFDKKCLQAKDFMSLIRGLSAYEKSQKPSERGQKCIAVPHFSPTALPCWEPAFYEGEYFPNYPRKSQCWVILRRTDTALALDKRKSPYFCVQRRHCFLLPSRFSSDFLLNYEPNSGVYAIKSDKGDVYVGWSGDIENRVADHNAGKGATFTQYGHWYRILPILKHPKAKRMPGERYSQESKEVHAQAKVAKRGCLVRGGYLSSSQ